MTWVFVWGLKTMLWTQNCADRKVSKTALNSKTSPNLVPKIRRFPTLCKSQSLKRFPTFCDCLMISPIKLVVGLFVIQIQSSLHLLIYDSTRPYAEKILDIIWSWNELGASRQSLIRCLSRLEFRCLLKWFACLVLLASKVLLGSQQSWSHPRQRKVSLKWRRTSITHSGRWVIQSSSSFRGSWHRSVLRGHAVSLNS